MPARGSLRPKDNYETPRIKDVEGDAKRRLPATSTSQLPLPAQFPTTTCVGVSSGEATPHSASRPHTAAHFSSHIELYSCCGCPRADWHLARSDRRADRKSTRLNSSHLVISYAVFCLKKKKI